MAQSEAHHGILGTHGTSVIQYATVLQLAFHLVHAPAFEAYA